MYGLDNNTNWEFGTYASNEFGHANWYSAIQCAMAILREWSTFAPADHMIEFVCSGPWQAILRVSFSMP